MVSLFIQKKSPSQGTPCDLLFPSCPELTGSSPLDPWYWPPIVLESAPFLGYCLTVDSDGTLSLRHLLDQLLAFKSYSKVTSSMSPHLAILFRLQHHALPNHSRSSFLRSSSYIHTILSSCCTPSPFWLIAHHQFHDSDLRMGSLLYPPCLLCWVQ